MLAVIGALTKDHDGWLILLAAVLCFVSCLTTFSLLARCAAAARQPVKMLWLFAASFAFASGVWGTQFVAFLGFAPRAVITFSLIDQDVSLLMATGCALAAFGVYVLGQETRSSAAAAGLLTGMVTAAMHVFGMRTMRNDGVLAWDPAIFAVALLIGGGFATAALLAVRGRRPWIGALCLTAAILGSSLTAMAALGAGSTPSGHGIGAGGMMPQAIATAPLAVAITAVSLLILASGLAGAVFDQYLSERSRQEAERLRQFADATFEGLLFWRNGVITDVNPPLCRMLQQSRLSLIGEPLASLVTAASLAMLTDRLERNGEEVFEAELALAGGGTRAVELVVRPFGAAGERTDESAGVVGIRDLSDRKAADLRIQQLAHYDSATGLANRFLFRDRLAQAISMADRTGRGVALFYLDLDRFKAVNDLFGHPAGDRLLQEAANRLSVCVRDTDTVARLGGDEFAIIQVLAGEMNPAATLAQRVLERLGDPYEIDGRVISVGVSIGIALYPHHGSSGETLLRNADLALYRAKASGREMFCFFAEDMDLQVRERQAMEHDLRDAIRRGELELNYQPLFDGQTLELKGHEALVRWRHPVRGNISPAVFIPLAEECGLIVQLGRWVLETACQEASHWDPAHYVAVNLSPRQFRQPDLAQMVMHILRTAGLPPHRLELEVTEGILIDDTERALKLLRFLKTQGVRLALDDFGTGYSSLSYLRRFPFDRIKIDRSFIQGLGGDEDAEAIIRAIVALGHSLRMEVTAEGVETEAQLASLRREHCGQVQGFLLGRPVPAAALHAAVGSDSGSL